MTLRDPSTRDSGGALTGRELGRAHCGDWAVLGGFQKAELGALRKQEHVLGGLGLAYAPCGVWFG